MYMLRLFISCLLLAFLPLVAQAAESLSVDEFTEALSPPKSVASSETNEPVEKKPRFKFRGIGGIQEIPSKPSVTMHLTFALDSAKLSERSKAVLTNLGQALEKKALRGYLYQLEGHTCDLGTEEHNMDLSQRRALAVRNYLADNFELDSKQFEVAWFGETQPLGPNTDETARHQNRRVVIKNTLKAFDLSIDGNQPVVMQVKCLRGQVEEVVSDGETLAADDRYAVEFKTTDQMYVYLYQVDTIGKQQPLFPNAKFSDSNNPVPPDSYRRLPSPGQWFFLDDKSGKEQIILFAAKKTIDDPNAYCAELVSDEAMMPLMAENSKGTFKTRGLGGIVHETIETKNEQDIRSSKLAESKAESSENNNVYMVRLFFIHR
ncbi:OmpA family protein [Desulfosarcina ovata]|uniref:OmpA-like domain-containing protein n=1 Tax=Desulfosarcina ovata subsp. ovata TaxID=2752305 RepID=A0A5K8AAX4_9BACT|nr:OmpA family protein [Desulfosarcina ovata]BBO89669.1 hypothetical protein DSCOOX_28490 [Desulfosarcina ovata subsp. ovata]